MESFLLEDIGSIIQNKAIERTISPMAIQLCHLIISMERQDIEHDVFASLEKMAEELAQASEEFVQVAKRLAEDTEEEWLQDEMKPTAESLILSGRNMTLVAQKLHLQPGCQSHQEELVSTAQQILVDTAKVLLLEDAAMARKMVRAAGWCLACLDALEAAGDAAWQQCGPWAELAASLQRLCGLSARGPRERLGRARRLLRGCVPALLAAAGAHLRRPRPPEPASRWLTAVTLARKSLSELLSQLERSAGTPEARTQPGALSRRLQQLRHGWRTSAPQHLASGTHDSRLAVVLWHCMRLAAGAAPPERSRLVGSCRLLLELRRQSHRPPRAGTSCPEPCEASAPLRAAARDLSQGIRLALLRQILDTFTDTQSPLQRLLQAASAKLVGDPERHSRSLQILLAAFLEQAGQMRRVAHLVLVCYPRPQTGQDLEVTVAGLWGLEETVRQLFSTRPPGSGEDPSDEVLQALLQAWAEVSECLLACFDEVLHIPEFLSVSIQEMTKHLHLFPWALKRGDSGEFFRHVVYLQGRATHIAQVMNRFVGQDRDPIFRNGLRVLIHQLNQSSLGLGMAAERCCGERSPRDISDVLVTARNLISSAQSLREGLHGTNHPAILSPLREQVRRVQRARGQVRFVLPSLLDALAPAWKCQRVLGLGERGTGTSSPPMARLPCPFITEPHLLPASSRLTVPVQRHQHPALPSVYTNLQEQRVAKNIAQGVVSGKKSLGPEATAVLREIPAPSPALVGLAPCSPAKPGQQQSGRAEETRLTLTAMAGDWYLLCQQLFCQRPDGDLRGSMAVFTELQQSLASMGQLAAQSGPMGLGKKDPGSTGHPEALLQMQDHLEEVAAHARRLLGQILASETIQPPGSGEKSIEAGCLLWSAAVQALLQCMERLCRAHGLFLLPLRQAVKDQQGLQEGLAQAAEVSQSLQEAARLSSQLCEEEQVRGEVIFLARDIQVLMDALLEVAQILAMSPRPSPSLSTRFELLCLELTLQVQALTGHLRKINVNYEWVLQEAVCPSLSVHEGSLNTVVSGVRAVQRIVEEGHESGPGDKDLLVALEDFLNITQELTQRVSTLQPHPEGWAVHVGWLQWEWAAKAHHAVAQLHTRKGGHTEAWTLLAQCLKLDDLPAEDAEQASSRPQLCCEEPVSGTAAGTVDSPDAAPKGPVRNPELICSGDLPSTETAAADLGMEKESQSWPPPRFPDSSSVLAEKNFTKELNNEQQDQAPARTPSCASSLHSQLGMPLPKDDSSEHGNRIVRITQEMTKEVFLMAQSLKRRGHTLTKDQFITSARKIAMHGHNFAKLIHIIAKNCIDQRCSQELVCAVEQIQTMSNQLRIISSVKASLARSKCSEELLVENAQQLLHAVSRTVRATEAARLRGLKQPSPDPEELGVAALAVEEKTAKTDFKKPQVHTAMIWA